MENRLSFPGFPAWKERKGAKLSELTRRRQMSWVSAVRRPDITFSNIPRYLKVCSRHFHSGEFKQSYEMDELNPDRIPTLNMGHCEVKATTSDRCARQLKRRYSSAVEGQATKTMVDQQVVEGAQQGSQVRFQMVLLTLMRLRLDLPVQYLCHLFNVSHTTLSNAFADTLDVLYARLKPMVSWPERHCLQHMSTMPPQFLETFGKRVAIIDCFELGTERPSNLKGWGGRASDKHITENCGLPSNVLPGDIVLADRGFDIKDSVGMMCAEVKMPSFTKGRCQLDAKDVEDTRALAHLRIHVERVIGCTRNKYKMLHRTIPIKLLLTCEGEEVTRLDKIVLCALKNIYLQALEGKYF
uniref:THAP-type domain-containing protein n=1 Tax=Xiphophorus maculatus TaxID=8083 RepID=A0A3B5R6Y8_XIPMA